MNSLVQSVTDALSALTVLTGIGIILILFFLGLKKFGAESDFSKRALDFLGARAMLFSFLIALGSMVSSLFYSGVAGFVPCPLCWWQRIFLFPQVFVLAVALARKDVHARVYTLTLSALGGIIAAYHTYITFGGSQLIPCSASGITEACTKIYFLEYGYVTIPTMALTAFAAIAVLAIVEGIVLEKRGGSFVNR